MATVSISALQVDEQVLPRRQSTVGPVRHIEGQLHTSQCRRSKVPLFPPVWPSRVHCALPLCALHLLCAPRVPPVASRHLRRRLFPVTWELLGRLSHSDLKQLSCIRWLHLVKTCGWGADDKGEMAPQLLLLLLLHQCQGGLLGAGEGLGSCAAYPFRAHSVHWVGGCPPHAPCCSEFGFCRPRVILTLANYTF